jgi:hypothetical protein
VFGAADGGPLPGEDAELGEQLDLVEEQLLEASAFSASIGVASSSQRRRAAKDSRGAPGAE